MIKRELKINMKSGIAWFLVTTILCLLVILLFPSLPSEGAGMEKMLDAIPVELLKILGMEQLDFNNFYSFYGGQGYTFITLLFGVYSALLGGSIVSKEFSDSTNEFLFSKPVSRQSVLLSKILVTFIYVTVINVLLFITTAIAINSIGELDLSILVTITLGSYLLSLAFGSVSMLVSLFLKRDRKILTASISIVLGMYLLNIVAALSSSLEFLKYFSLFEYVSSGSFIDGGMFSLLQVGVLMIVIIGSLSITRHVYLTKDFE